VIKEITQTDFEDFWPTFQSIIQAQETYAFEPDLCFEDAYDLWCISPLKTFVFKEYGHILGSYYLKANGMGPSRHICNCGYMVSEFARGKGIAKTLCQHSQQIARELGFRAMQFNAVVSSNKIAVSLWQKLGFSIVGTIPEGYLHRRLGYVDSYVMHKKL
jgi:GNAT superfamily N-acetyltransferase